MLWAEIGKVIEGDGFRGAKHLDDRMGVIVQDLCQLHPSEESHILSAAKAVQVRFVRVMLTAASETSTAGEPEDEPAEVVEFPGPVPDASRN